ncbi:MAG TPA: hypothetical protein VGK73_30675 [Polyangiaceae bacterium]
MRMFRQRSVPWIGLGLVLFAFSACDSDEKKRKSDDCEVDTDCDDDEFCDDGECEQRSSSGGSSGGTGAPTAGSLGSPGGTSSGGSGSSGSDSAWCIDICDRNVICPGAVTGQECVDSCVLRLAEERSYGCVVEYQLFLECGVAAGACETAALEAACGSEITAYANCLGISQ